MYTSSDSEILIYPPTDAHSIIQNCLECPNNSRWSFYSTFLPHSTCLCCSLHQSLFSLSPSLISLVCPSVAVLLGQQYFLLSFIFLYALFRITVFLELCLFSIFKMSYVSLLFQFYFCWLCMFFLPPKFTLSFFLFNFLQMMYTFRTKCLCVSYGKLRELTRPLALPCHATLMLCQAVYLCLCVWPVD